MRFRPCSRPPAALLSLPLLLLPLLLAGPAAAQPGDTGTHELRQGRRPAAAPSADAASGGQAGRATSQRTATPRRVGTAAPGTTGSRRPAAPRRGVSEAGSVVSW